MRIEEWIVSFDLFKIEKRQWIRHILGNTSNTQISTLFEYAVKNT